MGTNYDYRLLLFALLAAFSAVLVALSIAARVNANPHPSARTWTFAGALVLGSGMWSMHFIGLIASSLPLPASSLNETSIMPWLIAVSVAWLGLTLSSKSRPTPHELFSGSLLMGLGLISMHYASLYALHAAEHVVYSPAFVLLSVLVAIAASFIALRTPLWLSMLSVRHLFSAKIIAAAALAFMFAAMHYSAIAMAEFIPGLTAGAGLVDNQVPFTIVVVVGIASLLVATFIISLFYRHMHNSKSKNATLRESNEELNRIAMLDTLTQLPNRRLFQQHLAIAAERNARMHSSLAVAFIDLDDFKPINDTLGHHVGDEVLRAVAKRLNTAVRGCDVVARVGGDEFVALIEDIKSDQDILPIVQRIIHTLNDVFYIDNHEVAISASIGIAVYPRDGNIDRLIQSADAAMYRAKRDGKNQYRFFDSEIELASDMLNQMQNDLARVLEREELKLHFMPKMDGRTGKLTGIEALLRWHHPEKGLILPEIFVPVAERFGLINPIGEWVIEECCRVQHSLRKQGIDLSISVNLSSQQFRNPNLVSNILHELSRFDLPPSAFMFEITEAVSTQNPEQLVTLLDAFRAAGFRLSMDDFGIGHSSLVYLQSLNVDEVKLDQRFIAKISTSKKTRMLVDAVMRLAHAMELKVVAEGVETEAQRRILQEMGCDQLQGYLYSKPVPVEKLQQMLARLQTVDKPAN